MTNIPGFHGGMRPHPEALYFHIARDSVDAAKNESDEFRRKQLVATAIVFAAMCLEAFINQEYAVRVQELEEDFERVPLDTKWRALPLLLGATESFDRGKQPYQTFRTLVSVRNGLVHFKPAGQTRETGREYGRAYFGDVVEDVTTAGRYVECIAEMIRELNRLTNGKTDLPNFLKGDRYLSEVWASFTVAYESTSQQPAVGTKGSPEKDS